MKLLFDENLSAELPRLLAAVYPGSVHLREVELKGADDVEIWEYARQHGFAIVTKDDDFRSLSVLRGCPPKLVMICLGNCATRDVEFLLVKSRAVLETFGSESDTTVIELP